jgi:hypothetical protein
MEKIMSKINPLLLESMRANIDEIKEVITKPPDWGLVEKRFDLFFSKMININDDLWSKQMIDELSKTYYHARANDKTCTNITIRTVNAMPADKQNDTKKIFLQIADICRIFHASHKVNFELEELPENYPEIKMIPAKKKGFSTYAEEMPTLHKKISLTFDYWVPKIFDWTLEIREKGLQDWKGETILDHEKCTDFMRIVLMFISAPTSNLPIAKSDMREKILKNIFYKDFVWIKKSQKREDILTNSANLVQCLDLLSEELNFDIPYEAWSRLLDLKYIKAIIL